MSKSEIKIIPLTADENLIGKIVSLHKQLFDKEHFTARFNEKLLSKYFNLLLTYSDYKICAFKEQELIGYLIAGRKLDYVLKKFSREHFFRLIILLFGNPRFLIEKFLDLMNKIIYKNKKSKADMRLFLIASKHDKNIKGVGKSLIENLENHLIEEAIVIYGLSVRKHNQKAIDFYKHLGFIEEFRTHKSIYFIKKLS
ncbi:MAG: GNAT family N-acetyltransferase [Ignavibacterium sp.]|uniref:GNAT family N-acetyltransferase n=1 Tax=Ignavibacterium sp. TaxID=2651167 RepID=UPI004048FE7B